MTARGEEAKPLRGSARLSEAEWRCVTCHLEAPMSAQAFCEHLEMVHRVAYFRGIRTKRIEVAAGGVYYTAWDWNISGVHALQHVKSSVRP